MRWFIAASMAAVLFLSAVSAEAQDRVVVVARAVNTLKKKTNTDKKKKPNTGKKEVVSIVFTGETFGKPGAKESDVRGRLIVGGLWNDGAAKGTLISNPIKGGGGTHSIFVASQGPKGSHTLLHLRVDAKGSFSLSGSLEGRRVAYFGTNARIIVH